METFFFFQRINSFSVNNVHRAEGESILFIYKIFIGDTFLLAPDSCKCFICCALNHYKGGYYLGLKSSGSQGLGCWFFSSLKPSLMLGALSLPDSSSA